MVPAFSLPQRKTVATGIITKKVHSDNARKLFRCSMSINSERISAVREGWWGGGGVLRKNYCPCRQPEMLVKAPVPAAPRAVLNIKAIKTRDPTSTILSNTLLSFPDSVVETVTIVKKGSKQDESEEAVSISSEHLEYNPARPNDYEEYCMERDRKRKEAVLKRREEVRLYVLSSLVRLSRSTFLSHL